MTVSTTTITKLHLLDSVETIQNVTASPLFCVWYVRYNCYANEKLKTQYFTVACIFYILMRLCINALFNDSSIIILSCVYTLIHIAMLSIH